MRLIDADRLLEKVYTIENGGIYGDCEVVDRYEIENALTVEPRIEYGTDGQPYRLSMSGGQVVPDMLQGWRYEVRPQGEWGEWIRLDLAKRVIAKFEGYLDEDMIERIQIALEKENEAEMKGSMENENNYRNH